MIVNYWIRFRYLNDYTQLKEPPLVKPDANELHPDVNAPDPPPAFHNYLDDFLQAIRVFGFLEKPVSLNPFDLVILSVKFVQVFHELARHLQTRRLIAGDSISLDQDKSFYCVVDGTVQVFAQTGQPVEDQKGSWEDDDMNGYQLLNEVGSGGTLSSLFTILNLFTEDIKISWQDSEVTDSPEQHDGILIPFSRRNADVSYFDLDVKTPKAHTRESSASTVHPSSGPSSPFSPPYQSLSGSAAGAETPRVPATPLRAPPKTAEIHHGAVARALEDTTLAVIPAEAFRRLTKKFPKATGHIVQGDLCSLNIS